MEIIDMSTWKRRGTYERFITYTDPIFSLSTHLDVTELVEKCREDGSSFFANFLFLAVQALNSIEEFRVRIKGERVVRYDVIHPNYIVLGDDGVIRSAHTEFCEYPAFYRAVERDIAAARVSEDHSLQGYRENDVYYISSMKWVDLASMSNPYDLKDADSSSIPRLAWGKFVDRDGRKVMMMDIAVHHALIDGEQVCRAFLRLQDSLDRVREILK